MLEYMDDMEQTMEYTADSNNITEEITPDAVELDSSLMEMNEMNQPEENSEDALEDEKPKRRGRRKKEELFEEKAHAAADEGFIDVGEQPPSDFLDDEQEWPVEEQEKVGLESEFNEEEQNEGEDTDNDSPRTARTRRKAVILDSAGNVMQERTNNALHDLSILTAARNARRILTATVDAVEIDGQSLPRVVFYVGAVKVLIPFEQMGFDLDPELTSQREARLLIDSMLGAKIDYMVRGVDTEAKIVAASRRDAMLVRQRTILNARGTNQNYRINEGMRVMARILRVSQYNVRVEVYGFESYIPIDFISNVWVNDIREVIQVGEERPVEITKLVRGEDGQVTEMQVSMKAAEDAPQLQLRVENTYTGHIHSFSDTAYYVRVAGIPIDIRCPIKSNHTMELLSIGDLVKLYVRAVHDGVPTGAILKVLKKKVLLDY